MRPAERLNLAPSPAELLDLGAASGGPVDVLLPFSGNIIPQETSQTHLLAAACWTRATVLAVPNARQVPLALVGGLGAFPTATFEHIITHVRTLCALPEAMLRAWQRDGRDTWLEGRSRIGRSGSFRQQLEMAAYPFLATAEPSVLSSLADAPIVLLESMYTERFQVACHPPPSLPPALCLRATPVRVISALPSRALPGPASL